MASLDLKQDRIYFIVVWLVTYALWTIFFLMVGEHASRLPSIDLSLPLDHSLPLAPDFVWLYVLSYIYPMLPLFCTRDWHRFSQGLIAFMIANFSAFIVYMALPVFMQQPALGTSLAERCLSTIYAHDFVPSANKLPSMHVIAAWLICFMCWKQGLSKLTEWMIGIVAVLITISTLLTKQHLIVDVITGIAWASACWYAAKWLQVRFASEHGSARATFGRLATKALPAMAISGAALTVAAYWINAG